MAILGWAYARAGKRREALQVADTLVARANRQYSSPYAIAYLYAQLGETDEAFRWLERAYDEQDPLLRSLKMDAAIDPLRSDPRFARLLKRAGFE
jgi:tetratricopeptide (TPR) repeat protein